MQAVLAGTIVFQVDAALLLILLFEQFEVALAKWRVQPTLRLSASLVKDSFSSRHVSSFTM